MCYNNNMYKLPKKINEEIISYLSNVVVPSNIGANLIQIAQVLSKLEEIKDDEDNKVTQNKKVK